MRVLIAGGGIGGLVLALMLHARGVACEVFEAATEVRPLGVGIIVVQQSHSRWHCQWPYHHYACGWQPKLARSSNEMHSCASDA